MPATSLTALEGQKANDSSVGDLSERLTDVKIGVSENTAMENLTKDLASKWEPYGAHSSQPKAKSNLLAKTTKAAGAF
ncbi:hypothetical protein J4E93_004013 [Alternaria ventricosa]|uniref:uncharacterized protein n=1 Tax=Alternaria ventricosa TaxID=1187951 RepID=UPI0020C58621|nr:uncharacterized protein J4E93_004013 [Alternaria ventricosa]KAI4649693.1 hypothetical protein J4E93_004013 [Alternaria ventricosa]